MKDNKNCVKNFNVKIQLIIYIYRHLSWNWIKKRKIINVFSFFLFIFLAWSWVRKRSWNPVSNKCIINPVTQKKKKMSQSNYNQFYLSKSYLICFWLLTPQYEENIYINFQYIQLILWEYHDDPGGVQRQWRWGIRILKQNESIYQK